MFVFAAFLAGKTGFLAYCPARPYMQCAGFERHIQKLRAGLLTAPLPLQNRVVDQTDKDEIGCVERAIIFYLPAALAPANAGSVRHIFAVLLNIKGGRKQAGSYQFCRACAETQIPTSREESVPTALGQ